MLGPPSTFPIFFKDRKIEKLLGGPNTFFIFFKNKNKKKLKIEQMLGGPSTFFGRRGGYSPNSPPWLRLWFIGNRGVRQSATVYPIGSGNCETHG